MKTIVSAFERVGVPGVINACGIYTDLGGSVLSDSIWDALTELNSSYVDMGALLDRTGERIASLMGAEAARVTPGASAAISLAVATAIVGSDPSRGEQLPDTTGLKGEIVLQRKQADAYKYIAPVRLTGATLIYAGTSEETTTPQLHEAISPRTGAIFVPAHLDGLPGCVGLRDIVSIGRDRRVPVVVDAAYLNFPPARLRSFADIGADLTCFSAKYFFGPNAGGFVSGRREMIATLAGLDFTRHESGPYRRFGRVFKMGRGEIAAVCLALEEWFDTDHIRRQALYADRARHIAETLQSEQRLSVALRQFTLDETLADLPINAVVLKLQPQAGLTSQELLRRLAAGTPSVRAIGLDDQVVLVTETLSDGEDEIVARQVLNCLSGS